MGNSRALQKATKELTKAKAPSKPRDIIYDPMGQWKHPGQNTRIPGSDITMEGVSYPVYAQPNVGQPQMMYPGQEYAFPGADYVDEYPQMKRGGYMKGLVPMPKPSKKGLASKAYSRSLDATNRLFTESYLFKKPKDRKRKVFDPNAEYYADGGEYGMPLGTGVSQNFIGNRDNFKVGGIPELRLRDNQVNYNAFVNGFEPMSKKQDGGESTCPEGYVFYNGQCVEWQEPEVIETDENTGYNAATGEINRDTRPGSIENNDWWKEHEYFHHLQNLGGGMSTAGFLGQRPYNTVASDQAIGNYYDRRNTELEAQTDAMIKADPNLQFIPRNKLQEFTEGFPGANALMYQDPTTLEGEARVREEQFEKDGKSIFPQKQNGGDTDAMNGMMKARLAYANEFGNPAAKRMINLPDNPYQFDNGDTGTHYMASMDNYAVPQIQDENGQLMLGDYGPESNEALRFDTDDDANYFAEHYKDVSPGFIEAELTDDEIQAYRDGGYIVEDISVSELNTMDKGGIFKRRKKKQEEKEQLEYRPPVEVNDELYESVTPFPEAPEDFKQGVGNIKEIEKKAQAPDWLNFSNEYEKKNSKQAFIDEKKREYLKSTNKGLNKLAGNSMEDFPEAVEKNFEKAYDYKKNTYVAKKLGKEYGFSPNRRGEWVDYLSKGERNIIANSKFESKLQPSLWDKTLAGLVTLTTPFSAQANDAMNRGELPGLTKREQREIKDSELFGIPVGGLEALAGWDAPGVAIANALEQSGNSGYGAGYREAPGVLSAQPMANVKPEQAMVLNPLNYMLPYDIVAAGPSLVKGMASAIKGAGTAAKTTGKFLTEATPLKNASKINPSNVDELVDLWRIQEKSGKTFAQLAEEGKINPLFNNPATLARKAEEEKYFGQWFTKDKNDFDFYKADREFTNPEIINLKVPKSKLEQYSQYDKSLSRAPDREFVIPLEEQKLYKELPGSSNKSFMGKVKDYFDRPPGPLMLGMSKGAVFNKEIKNPDYFLDLMKINKYSAKNKKYFEDLIATVKKQGNVASERQYDELQRLKTGDMNYGKKGYARGGIVSELSKREINDLVSQGYIVEDVD